MKLRLNKLSILLAIVALIVSTLACAAAGGEPAVSNFRTANDEDGAQPASVFGSTDIIYAVGDISNGAKGNVVLSKWYAVEIPDVEPNFLIDDADIVIEEDSFTGTIFFSFEPPEGGWPAGTYKVEILFNDVLITTLDFSVQ